jgi:hypothetical protein
MLASSIADVPLGFKGLDESPYHVQATTVRLNKRRKAKNPVMPIPSNAIEVGSGTVATPTVSVPCVPAVTPVSEAVENVIAPGVPVLNSNTKDPLAAAVKLASTVFGPISVYVIPERLELTVVTGPIGSTPGVYVTSISVAVPPLFTEKLAVVTTDPAWLGVANATLASKPAAKVKKSDRFVIEFS